MSAPVFEMTLLDGRLSLRESAARGWAELSDIRTDYAHAQDAVDRVLTAIAARTGRTRGDRADDDAMKEAFGRGTLRLTVRGHQRECRVVALHVHVRLGLDFQAIVRGDPSTAIRVEAVPDAADGYATYHFDSDMRPLNALRDLLESWHREAERLPEAKAHVARQSVRWEKLVRLGQDDAAPLCVVVTGVTGAGKSTFLNAVLGMDLLPCSTSVCTATLLHLKKAQSKATEGIVVKFRPESTLVALSRQLEAEIRRGSTMTGQAKATLAADVKDLLNGENTKHDERLSELARRRKAIDTAAGLAREPPRRRALTELNQFARVDLDGYAEAVQSIDVFVDHPLLSLVELIDAPGLRDGDDWRQRVVIQAFAGDVAWLYLAPATTRDNSCVEDWTHIRQLSHNEAGVLLLTKADELVPDPSVSLMEALQRREADYRSHGWQRPSTWCAAVGPSKLALLRPGADGQAVATALGWARLPNILALSWEANRRLENFAMAHWGGQDHWETLRDYVLDASRLPAALRYVGRTLYDDAIAWRVSHGRAALRESVQEAVGVAQQGIEQAQRMLQAHDVVAEKTRHVEEVRALVAQAMDEERQLSERRLLARWELDAAGRQCTNLFKWKSDVVRTSLDSMFDASFARDSRRILMSGARSFAFVSEFEGQLSAAAHEVLQSYVDKAVENFGSGIDVGEFRKNYVLGHVESWGDVSDQESFFERASTTRNRMWSTTKAKADLSLAAFRSAVDGLVSKISERFDAYFADRVAEQKAQVAQYQRQATALTEEIATLNPAQSREKARTTLASLTEHRAAFTSFLDKVAGHEP